MARLQLDLRPAGPGDEAALAALAPDRAEALAALAAGAGPGRVVLLIASREPDPAGPPGPPEGSLPGRSLGHDTPSWDRPGWDEPDWDAPGWDEPDWQRPSWDRSGWTRPSWSRPSWETDPETPPDWGALPVPDGAISTSLSEPAPALGATFEAPHGGLDGDRFFLELDVPAPAAPVPAGALHLEPTGDPPAPLAVRWATVAKPLRHPVLGQCLAGFVRRWAREHGHEGVEGLEALAF